jgi:hypothetical protein
MLYPYPTLPIAIPRWDKNKPSKWLNAEAGKQHL